MGVRPAAGVSSGGTLLRILGVGMDNWPAVFRNISGEPEPNRAVDPPVARPGIEGAPRPLPHSHDCPRTAPKAALTLR